MEPKGKKRIWEDYLKDCKRRAMPWAKDFLGKFRLQVAGVTSFYDSEDEKYKNIFQIDIFEK